MTMKIAVRPTAALSPADWDAVWHLTERFYACERSYAEARLRERQLTALVHDADGELAGMASIEVIQTDFEDRPLTAFFTSHVLLREDLRGRNVLQRIGLRVYLAERLRHPLRAIYWFFDTFSYKSYLLLPNNCREFWPRHDRPTPPRQLALMDRLARQVYGADWDAQRGIVQRSGRKRLRAGTAPLTPDLGSASPHLAFFARANPGHAEGDMLVCLCPLTLANWAHAAARALGRMLARRRDAPRTPLGGHSH
ncbi:hypothetical protein [Pelomonas sp. KK5]|uniref:hypothetical protein n=1 Tax=Pelomonas sp. KK5 TaxID=1855730 RepID=UPI00097C421D|nr:hypothetical protein [Pelomonas sp. KK5]